MGKIDGLSESGLRSFLKAGERGIEAILSLPSDATEIKTLRSEPSHSGEDIIYSLKGERVTNPAKGVYIKNGKKTIE